MADDLEDIKKRLRELEQFRSEITTGRKVIIWVFAAIGATAVFFITLYDKITGHKI